MTGKEALNLLFCTSEGLSEYKVYECKKILEKELELLTKYKRAFEIFKRLINDEFTYVDLENGVFDGTIDITEEEYELLEELMKDEEC